ncbi:MAG: M4 family metallopeptidase [Saprospiraceae bacterium]|nr:M4 family metallopeptidase [Saprospiraceae bacterium]
MVSMEVGTQEATKLWFEALRTMKPTARFRDLYRALVAAAKEEDVAAQLPKNIKEILTTASGQSVLCHRRHRLNQSLFRNLNQLNYCLDLIEK